MNMRLNQMGTGILNWNRKDHKVQTSNGSRPWPALDALDTIDEQRSPRLVHSQTWVSVIPRRMSSCSHLCFFTWVWDFLAAVSFVVMIEIVNDWNDRFCLCCRKGITRFSNKPPRRVKKKRHALILGGLLTYLVGNLAFNFHNHWWNEWQEQKERIAFIN